MCSLESIVCNRPGCLYLSLQEPNAQQYWNPLMERSCSLVLSCSFVAILVISSTHSHLVLLDFSQIHFTSVQITSGFQGTQKRLSYQEIWTVWVSAPNVNFLSVCSLHAWSDCTQQNAWTDFDLISGNTRIRYAVLFTSWNFPLSELSIFNIASAQLVVTTSNRGTSPSRSRGTS